MPLPIMKLCVGCASVDELVAWIDFTLAQKQAPGAAVEQLHTTRMVPRHIDKLHEDSSLYRVIKAIFSADNA